MARRSLRNACLPYLMETTAGEALAETQLAVEAAVTVRDRVVEAYQEILRMQV